MTRARGIWQGVGWGHVTGAEDMWQGVEAGGMWQGVGSCGRVWGHVAGCGSMWQVWW